MKKGKLIALAAFLVIILLCAFTGCANGNIVAIDFDKLGVDLMKDSKVIMEDDIFNKKESSMRANLLKDSGSWTVKKGVEDYKSAEFELKEKSTFNTAVICEDGSKVKYFRLEAFVDDAWKTIYKSEKLNKERVISFDAVTTKNVRLIIDNMDGKSCKIKRLKLYNLNSDTQKFNTTVYQRLDGDVPTEIWEKGEEYRKTFARYYDVYNTIIIFGAVNWSESGELVFANGEDWFREQITILKKIVNEYRTNPHEVKIILTALADGAGGGHIGVNTLMHANHTRIATEMVDKFIKPESEGGYDLDGLDIDWEFPQNAKDWKCYDVFMKELDEKMNAVKPSAIISAALSASALKMSKETIGRIDQIQYMAYDNFDSTGIQSTLHQAQIGIQNFVKKGVDLKKINLGIPSYGRPNDYSPYWPTWRELEAEAGVTKESMYFNNIYYNFFFEDKYMEVVGYCSPALAGDKTAVALFSNCGGIMVFRLACDKLMDDPNAVACGIENTLKRYGLKEWTQYSI